MNSDQSVRRVFPGIRVPEATRSELAAVRDELALLPVRVVHPLDLHITLLPPWNWHMEDEAAIRKKMEEAVDGIPEFNLRLTGTMPGPQADRPHLIWVVCEPAPEMVKLRNRVMAVFESDDKRTFHPHITLARFRYTNRNEVLSRFRGHSLDLSMAVKSLDLFLSEPWKEQKYSVLHSVDLNQGG